MKKTPRTEKTQIDLSKPLLSVDYMLKSYDCFGQQWQIDNSICQKCADFEFCANVFRIETLKPKIELLQSTQGPFLDQSDFEKIDRELLAVNILTKEWDVEYVFDFIKKSANVKSESLVITFIQQLFTDFNLKSVKGKIIKI